MFEDLPALAISGLNILDLASWCLIGLGAILSMISGLGVLRLNDLFTRLHAASVADTGGMMLILGGLMLQSGLELTTVKLVLIVIFLLITSPTATHALARAARQGGVVPQAEAQSRPSEGPDNR